MTQHIAWSWSRLNTFEQCPRKFFLQNISKELKYVRSAAAKRGDDLHKSLELACNKYISTRGQVSLAAELPAELAHMSKLISGLLRDVPAIDSTVDTYYAVDADFTVLSNYFSKATFLRFSVDLGIRRGKKATIIDWKTGKNYGYADQLKLMAAVTMSIIWPGVDEVTAYYVYVDQNEVSKRTFKRDDLDDIWDDLLGRAYQMQKSVESGEWPECKNNFCKWCDATPAMCKTKRGL